ncbi:MAG: hypothetical protein JRG92_09515 [Deltaproteobacteria bacterium]|jgi:hypothetical protein|nr:hypothetical protein [Deltaproteobacteria bacterium]MBW2383863.1 hypothetical protein [Deltaproteobacteria bacterium]MBW2695070.1 hypothetical protein [Deltaproteobacteria bacterium]
MQAIEIEPIRSTDWRLRISLGITAAWLLLGFIYISSVVGWTAFVQQNAPSLGSFLEGAFAPLAFLWLVVGFFLQQQQLHDNTRTIQAQLEEMRRSAKLAEVQARAIAADELHSRQDTFLRIKQLVDEQLGMISGWIVTSRFAFEDDVMTLWRRGARGEDTAFSLDLIRRCLPGQNDPGEVLWGTEIRTKHTRRFVKAFERLLEAGEHCDPSGIIVEALRESAHGRVYRMMTESEPGTSAT